MPNFCRSVDFVVGSYGDKQDLLLARPRTLSKLKQDAVVIVNGACPSVFQLACKLVGAKTGVKRVFRETPEGVGETVSQFGPPTDHPPGSSRKP